MPRVIHYQPHGEHHPVCGTPFENVECSSDISLFLNNDMNACGRCIRSIKAMPHKRVAELQTQLTVYECAGLMSDVIAMSRA